MVVDTTISETTTTAAAAAARCSARSTSALMPTEITSQPAVRPRPYSVKLPPLVRYCVTAVTITATTLQKATPAKPIDGGSALARQTDARSAMVTSRQCLRIRILRAGCHLARNPLIGPCGIDENCRQGWHFDTSAVT